MGFSSIWKGRKLFSGSNKSKNGRSSGEGRPSDRHFINNGSRLLEALITSCHGRINPIRMFSATELMEATDCYNDSRLLGSGISMVYHGIHDGQSVAVKRSFSVFLNHGDYDPFDLFLNEVVSLAQINHKNVVRLLGCCIETPDPIPVYELVPGGTLHQHIHLPGPSCRIPWADRLRIALEIGDALSYLHTAFHTPIVHGNVQSSSILLDGHCRAKLCVFAFSEVVPRGEVQSRRGSARRDSSLADSGSGCGFGIPEAEKRDIYGFGLVLIELLTCKMPSEIYSGNDHIRLDNFFSSVQNDLLGSVLDESILNDADFEQLRAFAWVAVGCAAEYPEQRPTMKKVVQELRLIGG